MIDERLARCEQMMEAEIRYSGTEESVDKRLVYISFHATTFLMHERGATAVLDAL